MFAAHQNLDNLIGFTDYNKLQLDDLVENICSVEPLADKWKAFGWEVIEVANGNDCNQVDEAISSAKVLKKPVMVILNTVKGRGIGFAERAGIYNHSMPVTKEMLEEGLKELRGEF